MEQRCSANSRRLTLSPEIILMCNPNCFLLTNLPIPYASKIHLLG